MSKENYFTIVDTEHDGDPKNLFISTKHGFQIQIEQDGQDAYIDLEGVEVRSLIDRLHIELGRDSPFYQKEQKAKSLQLLKENIAKHYAESSESDLGDIGETAAIHFGFL